MKKAIYSIFVLAITVALSGCLITTRGHSKHKSRSCHPSEYWDGHKCKHKKHKKKDKHDHRKKDKHDHRKHDKKHKKKDKKKDKHDHRKKDKHDHT